MDHESKQDKSGKSTQDLAANETPGCLRWEAAVVDLLDGGLSAEEEAALRSHAAECPHCEILLEQAGSGQAWIRMLHEAPVEVPGALIGRILAQTSEGFAATTGAGLGAAGLYAQPVGGLVPGASLPGSMLPGPGGRAFVLPAAMWMMRGQREARLLMTAAMAFFSIALTLSMTGVRPGNLHAAVEAPAQLQASASRQFFDTKKQVVSFYDNLRLVREMEANVHDALHDFSGQGQQGTSGSHKSDRQRVQPSARIGNPSIGLPLLAAGTLHVGGERNTL
jgi:hypothetical protein